MAKLTKTEYSKDVNYYEMELTPEMLALYKKDPDLFWDTYDDVDWEWIGEKIINPDEDIELVEE